MRRTALALVVLFVAPALLGMVAASTPDEIILDGDMTDWPTYSLLSTDSNAVTFRMTWNDTHLFLGWSGTDWASESEGADLFVYLNTSEGGSPLSKDWNLAQTLPFAADHALCWRIIPTHLCRPMMEQDGLTVQHHPQSGLVGLAIKTRKLQFLGVESILPRILV